MEKRLALAILLSLVVLTVFQLLQPQPEPSESQPVLDSVESVEPGPGEASEPASVAAADGPQASAAPAAVLAAEVEQEHVVDFGTPGEVGHFRATFTNRGAELVELLTGSYYRRVGLSEQERADPANWLPLIEDVTLADGERPAGGFAMRAIGTSEGLVDAPLGDVLWAAEELDGGGIEFRYAGANGVVFVKRFEPVPGTWDLAVQLAIESPQTLTEGLRPGVAEFAMVAVGTVGVEVDDSFYKQPKAVAVGPEGGSSFDLESKNADFNSRDVFGALDVPPPLAVVGGHNKYFAVLLRGADMLGARALRSANWRRVDALGLVPPSKADELTDDGSVGATRAPQGYVYADVELELRLPEAGQRESWDLRMYAGPKDHGQFLDVAKAHKKVLDSDLSFFSGIGNFLIDVLNVLHAGTGNWGVSIILLTLLIRTILFPLNRRSQTAMARYQAKMKRLQPKLEALKEKYKDQPKELQQAQAKFMQEEGAFPPLGGCLPIFLQMPVFFGLFAALRTSFDLRQAGFVGYIQDLSRPDQLFYHGVDLPLFGEYFNLLPPLMVVMWIWQQRSMPQPSDEQARQMQRIMLFMPVVMGVFLYNYAAGLSLYMVTQSTLGIIEQRVIKKIWPIDDTELEKKPGKGCGPFAEAIQKAAEQQQVRQKELEKQKAQLQKKKQQRKKR